MLPKVLFVDDEPAVLDSFRTPRRPAVRAGAEDASGGRRGAAGGCLLRSAPAVTNVTVPLHDPWREFGRPCSVRPGSPRWLNRASSSGAVGSVVNSQSCPRPVVERRARP
jgi:hypothetical protein